VPPTVKVPAAQLMTTLVTLPPPIEPLPALIVQVLPVGWVDTVTLYVSPVLSCLLKTNAPSSATASSFPLLSWRTRPVAPARPLTVPPTVKVLGPESTEPEEEDVLPLEEPLLPDDEAPESTAPLVPDEEAPDDPDDDEVDVPDVPDELVVPPSPAEEALSSSPQPTANSVSAAAIIKSSDIQRRAAEVSMAAHVRWPLCPPTTGKWNRRADSYVAPKSRVLSRRTIREAHPSHDRAVIRRVLQLPFFAPFFANDTAGRIDVPRAPSRPPSTTDLRTGLRIGSRAVPRSYPAAGSFASMDSIE
jgi:hypothetical protein